MNTWGRWLAAAAGQRTAAGLHRALRPRGADEDFLDLAGNDYLGLSRHPAVVAAAAAAVHTWGAGAGASRLVTGTLAVHDELERELAAFTGHESALVFSTGYQANLGVVGALADREAVIISDAHVHASLIDAARLSRARVEVVPHNDVAAVRAALAAAAGRRCLVLTESVFSVLGDAAPLPALAAACAEHGALLVVDEAHGLGVVGPGGGGLVAGHGLGGHPSVVVTATLSKALGAQGGAVLGPATLRDHLVNSARSFIFDTALAPAAAAGALAALRHLAAEPDLPRVIHERVALLGQALGCAELPVGAVLSVPMASPAAAVEAQVALQAAGIRVGCFRPPSVPDGISRLRITCNAGVPEADWARAVARITTVARG
ncbi:aminotransferase class I/II-fold pyridoxal phosphate-dependent enzyme [Nocardioides sp. AE5]|uniref:aminotransferase class I/II-fold pyridoxal phosphate-dependent enzyme n=1 Tax=Nocardioides sp. AE5 TaxID=2962573 RepID=UPI00288157EC|nr:aminotransferase class I/II-fold pyridoxal phosphate-dependent enzyme [Nocardioides sp. AE5]MDT0202870.1 aminotransferase class I/II-fold pyridoxal phosphate-dependent enzyme [Nocardioides sp. AE5]